jgi:hypothetical protein
VSLLLHKSISFSLPAAIKVFRIKDVLRPAVIDDLLKPDMRGVFSSPI